MHSISWRIFVRLAITTVLTSMFAYGWIYWQAQSTEIAVRQRVLLNQATGSGARANQYAHSSTPSRGNPGVGNQLEIVGNANSFDQTNQNFFPPPPAEFFTGGH